MICIYVRYTHMYISSECIAKTLLCPIYIIYSNYEMLTHYKIMESLTRKLKLRANWTKHCWNYVMLAAYLTKFNFEFESPRILWNTFVGYILSHTLLSIIIKSNLRMRSRVGDYITYKFIFSRTGKNKKISATNYVSHLILIFNIFRDKKIFIFGIFDTYIKF